MSHASVLLAVEVVDPKDRTEIETAVQFQMAPFDENDEWFRDGSRWDWYQIGGRFSGMLDGYNPDADPANLQTCKTCGGSGVRPGGGEQFGEEWFKACNGCNGCNGTGNSSVWPTSRRAHDGDIALVRDVNLSKFDADAPYAFLHDRHWHEPERLGWFGGTAKTECEIHNPGASVEEMIRRCVTKCDDMGARIIVWNEPYEIWKQEFRKRFIEPLKPETVLVVVDYHV